jgi:hypothetical protein
MMLRIVIVNIPLSQTYVFYIRYDFTFMCPSDIYLKLPNQSDIFVFLQ